MDQKIVNVIKSYYTNTPSPHAFLGGTMHIPVSGKVFDEEELMNGVEAVLDGWWTDGRME